jgi:superfamily II DNA/RNA helicase
MQTAAALANDADFKLELAQIASRVAMRTLAQKQEATVAWTYNISHVKRNISAITLALREVAQVMPDVIDANSNVARFAAEAWEQLAALVSGFEAKSSLLASSALFDLAGYEANAICLARRASNIWESDESTSLDLAALFMQRKYVKLHEIAVDIGREPSEDELDRMSIEEMSHRTLLAMLTQGLVSTSRYFLNGSVEALEEGSTYLESASEGFASLGFAAASTLTKSIVLNLPVMEHRSTWKRLNEFGVGNARWSRYLRVLGRGLGDDLLNGVSVSELWPSQIRAIERGLLTSQESFIIRMPTSAGKTRVAEMAIVHTLAMDSSARCVYIAPYRALASEVDAGFESMFADLGYSSSKVTGTFEHDSLSELEVAQDQILVLTPEKLDLLLRFQPEVLSQLKLIVIDEGHIVGDRSRGPKFELLITRLRKLIPSARFLFMSAVVPLQTLNQLAEWLGGSEDSVAVTGWRPSIQRFARLEWINGRGTLRYSRADVETGGINFIPNIVRQQEFEYVSPDTGRRRRPKFPDSKGQVAAELAFLYVQQGPVLIYCANTQWAESVAKELMERVTLAELTNEPVPEAFRVRQNRSASVAEDWLGADNKIVKMFNRGIGFHHGRLPEAIRESVEYDVRRRNINVLVATSTLAQGVNLPFRTVIFHSPSRFDEDQDELQRISARDYWNIAGRAGRAGHETEGLVIHIVASRQDAQNYSYFENQRTQVEPLESALLKILRDLVDGRISSPETAAKLDSDLLALLVEENESILDLQVLDESLGSTLFSIQALRENIPTEPLISLIHQAITGIAERVPDVALRRIYASTGLSSNSCEIIRSHVEENSDALRLILSGAENSPSVILDLMVEGVLGLIEMTTTAPDVGGVRNVLDLWLSGSGVANISGELGVDATDLSRFIDDMFAYRLPWGLSGYLRIAEHLLQVESEDSAAVELPSLIKYGVPSREAAWTMTAGVVPRRAAIDLANRYKEQDQDTSPQGFRRWLSQLEIELLSETFEITGASLESTARAVYRSGTNEYLKRLDENLDIFPLDLTVRPSQRAIDVGEIASLRIDDEVELKRDYDSLVNRNSVLCLKQGAQIGYISWSAAQAIAPELDVGVSIVGIVTSIENSNRGAKLGIRILRL